MPKIRLFKRMGPMIRSLRDDEIFKQQESKLPQLWHDSPGQMARLDELYSRAQLFLEGRDLSLCHEMIRSAIAVVSLTDSGSSKASDRILRQYADHVGGFLEKRAERAARRRYATGLYLGVLISVCTLAAVALIAIVVIRLFLQLQGGTFDNNEALSLRDALVCIGGGAAGAVVSTLLRLNNIEKLDYESISRRTAAHRVVLGWFFAAAVLFLIKGEIVAILPDPTEQILTQGGNTGAIVQSFFFWGGLGFLAGFNERWAQNLITRPELKPDKEQAPSNSRPDDRPPAG